MKPTAQRVTNEQVIAAYRQTGNIWKAAKLLGIGGQSLWERLKRLGVSLANERWSDEEVAELLTLAESCTLAEIGRRLGRSYAGVACKVSELGIGVRYGNRVRTKLKRGSGLTKAAVAQYIKQLSNWGGPLRQFCVQRGIDLEQFVRALQHYAPDYWATYTREHSDMAMKRCPQCSAEFVPMTGKQKTCSRKCASSLRVDAKYFGGKRGMTIGLAEGVCQLCERERKVLSSHHMFGKDNDPDNDFLVALCSGCHQLVGIIGSRSDIDKPEFFETLIILALTRKYGHRKPVGFHVCVDIDELTEEDVLNDLEAAASAPMAEIGILNAGHGI